MRRGLATLLVIGAMISGCSVTEDWWRMPGSTERPDAVDSRRPSPVGIEVYLDTMLMLAEGDIIDQAEIFSRVEQANNVSPTTTNRLMYALALSTPGHPNANPREAQALLSELLATPENMVTDERALAEIQLLHTERTLVLESESARFRNDSRRLSQQQQANTSSTARRLRALQSENQELKGALDEANEKLDAISLIERTIIETSESQTGSR